MLSNRPPRVRLLMVGLALLAGLTAGVSPAAADIVYLSSGRTMSVKRVTYAGNDATLTLRAGGEVVFDRALIARVEPDEVPYPEPEAESVVGAVAAVPEQAGVTQDVITAGRPMIPAEFDALVNTLATRHGVDARLVHAVITVESAYQPRARSVKGARGLMQLMPATAKQYGVRNAYNPAANLEAGIKHLRSLLDRFDLKLAVAAYNAGEASVLRFGGIPPYPETRDYVAKVLRLAGVVSRSR
jgi:soluble lytic murein transglycosylase-like protein